MAEKADVSIGSLYQYFPDKAAIIRTLADRFNAEDRACIEAELADVRDAAGLQTAFARLIDIYYALFLAEPVRRDIWPGTQADKTLLDIYVADSRAVRLAVSVERAEGDALVAVVKRMMLREIL